MADREVDQQLVERVQRGDKHDMPSKDTTKNLTNNHDV